MFGDTIEDAVHMCSSGKMVWITGVLENGFCSVRWKLPDSGFWHEGGKMFGQQILKMSKSVSAAPGSYRVATSNGIAIVEPSNDE